MDPRHLRRAPDRKTHDWRGREYPWVKEVNRELRLRWLPQELPPTLNRGAFETRLDALLRQLGMG